MVRAPASAGCLAGALALFLGVHDKAKLVPAILMPPIEDRAPDRGTSQI